MAAVEYMADASLNSAKFASRALAYNVITRRLLWLCHWNADMRSKWKLASAPFKGEALDLVLIKNKDKKKVMPSVSKKAERKGQGFFQKQSFCASEPSTSSGQYHRPFAQGSNRSQDRQSFRDRGHQQFFSKGLFRGGSGSRPFRCYK